MDFSNQHESSRQVGHIREEDVEFKILIFTDNHVGFKETHPIRGQVGWNLNRTHLKPLRKFFKLLRRRRLTWRFKVEISIMIFIQVMNASARHSESLKSMFSARGNTHSDTIAYQVMTQRS